MSVESLRVNMSPLADDGALAAKDFVRATNRRDESEDELLMRLQNDYDPEAFGEIYERYYSGVYRYIYYRVGESSLAEDLTMEVFVRAMEHIDGYTFRGVPFSAWLYKIANNLVVDHFRRQPKIGPVSLDESLVAALDKPGDTDRLEAIARNRLLLQALSELTPDQQRVVAGKFGHGASNLEIAGVLGKTEGAVKSLQHRALATLGRAFAAAGYNTAQAGETRERTPVPLHESDIYQFGVGIFRFDGHPALLQLIDPDEPVERTTERNHIFMRILVPAIDEMPVLQRKILFMMFFEMMPISLIKNRLDSQEVSVEDVLAGAREHLRAVVERETGYNTINQHYLFKGTLALWLLMRPLGRQNLRAIGDNEAERSARAWKPKQSGHNTMYHLTLSDAALCRVLGVADRSGSIILHQAEHSLPQTEPIINSSITMLVPAGVSLASRDGATIIVHVGAIKSSQSINALGEVHVTQDPKVLPASSGSERYISEVRTQAGFKDRHPEGETAAASLIRIVHKDAWDELPMGTTPQEAQEIWSKRRAELRRIYADYPQVDGKTRRFVVARANY